MLTVVPQEATSNDRRANQNLVKLDQEIQYQAGQLYVEWRLAGRTTVSACTACRAQARLTVASASRANDARV
jgi:hypothetical protein